MNEYEKGSLSLIQKIERKEAQQLQRLVSLLADKLLVSELFENCRSMSYPKRCAFEKMSVREDERVKNWHDALSIKDAFDIKELRNLLNAESPDLQKLSAVCTKHGLQPEHIGLLLALFSQGKLVGIAELMSERGKTKRKKTSEQYARLGIRWLQLEHEDPHRYGTKFAVALQLAEEMEKLWEPGKKKLKPETIFDALKGPRERNTTLFPDGLEAARRAAGLPPMLHPPYF